MIVCSLFPGGILQFRDVLVHGYWHARGLTYLDQGFARTIEWIRLPGDSVFIAFGVIPLVIAAIITYVNQWKAVPEPKPSIE